MKGNSIAQYGIVIGLAVLVITPGFFMIGDTIVKHFNNFYEGLAAGNSSIVQSIDSNGNSSTGKQGYDLPVSSECEGSTCTIKLGDKYTLTGVSTDIAEIIETSGSTGATEHLASVLEQLAKQVKNDPTVSEEDKSKIDYLASLAYEMAGKEKIIEEFSKEVLPVFIDSLKSIDIGYLNTLTSPERANYIEEKLQPFINYLDANPKFKDFYSGLANISGEHLPPKFLSVDMYIVNNDVLLRRDFDKTLKDLTVSSDLDPQLQSVVKLLSNNVTMLADNMFNVFDEQLDLNDLDNSLYIITQLAAQESYATGAVNNLNSVIAPFEGINTANDGLTSEQTNLDAQLIDVAEDGVIDATPEQSEDTNAQNQDQNTENTNENSNSNRGNSEENRQDEDNRRQDGNNNSNNNQQNNSSSVEQDS